MWCVRSMASQISAFASGTVVQHHTQISKYCHLSFLLTSHMLHMCVTKELDLVFTHFLDYFVKLLYPLFLL